jgi:hypothetical protein
MNGHRGGWLGLIVGAVLMVVVPGATPTPPREAGKDNEELSRLFREDQADRMPGLKAIDWKAILPRDRAREARVKGLYRDNRLKTGADYFHAAMVLQHGAVPEDYLLAHELCVVAISKGDARAKWLAAASEDRFLMSIQRPQRFGTQYRGDASGQGMRLYRVDDEVTDGLRRELSVPSLAEARKRETGDSKKSEKK